MSEIKVGDRVTYGKYEGAVLAIEEDNAWIKWTAPGGTSGIIPCEWLTVTPPEPTVVHVLDVCRENSKLYDCQWHRHSKVGSLELLSDDTIRWVPS